MRNAPRAQNDWRHSHPQSNGLNKNNNSFRKSRGTPSSSINAYNEREAGNKCQNHYFQTIPLEMQVVIESLLERGASAAEGE